MGKISGPSQLARKEVARAVNPCISKNRNSIGSSPDSCAKGVISPEATVWVVNLFLECNLTMSSKMVMLSTLSHFCYRWLTVEKNTQSSQFFITVAKTSHLDGKH